MNYIVLDLEWNQAVSRRRLITTPILLNGEIIQIGAVKVNDSLEELGRFNEMIKPKFYTTMHPTVKNLTGIKNADIEKGGSFPDVIKAFREWCGTGADGRGGEEFVFVTWSMNDLSMMRDNLTIYELPSEWLPPCYDAQKLFDRQFIDDDHQHSLGYAMYIFKEKPLVCHDALNDAANTVTVLRHMMGGEKLTEDYLDISSDEPMYYTHMKIKPELVEDDSDLSVFGCFDCDEYVVCRNWKRQTSYQLVTIGRCQSGHEFFVRLRFKKIHDGLYEVYRVVYDLDAELEEIYEELE
jgi:DNA polymerase III epsilon subunit-like protein